MTKFATLLLGASMMLGTAANAALLVNQSPDATGMTSSFYFNNMSQEINFLFGFTVSATTLTGVDIYSDCNSDGCGVSVGRPVIVKLTGDVGGAPDDRNIVSYATTISEIDSALSTAHPALQRFHADFSQRVNDGTYWIGLGGDNNDLSMTVGFPSNGQAIWLLYDNHPLFEVGQQYTAGFNVYGDVYGSAVPEPASWALMIAGFGLVGAARRRQRSAAVAA